MVEIVQQRDDRISAFQSANYRSEKALTAENNIPIRITRTVTIIINKRNESSGIFGLSWNITSRHTSGLSQKSPRKSSLSSAFSFTRSKTLNWKSTKNENLNKHSFECLLFIYESQTHDTSPLFGSYLAVCKIKSSMLCPQMPYFPLVVHRFIIPGILVGKITVVFSSSSYIS